MAELYSPTQQELMQKVAAVRSWFASDKGQKLLALEQPFINEALSYYFGRFLLDVGPFLKLAEPIKDINTIVSLGCEGANVDIISEEYAWPIQTESVEIVTLRHALDFSYSPHNLLREAARCIRPGGHLLIVGLNPYSLWGVYRRCHFGIWSKSHSVSMSRLFDWLRLLGFAIEQQWTGAYCLPTKGYKEGKLTALETIGQKYHCWGNGFYVVSARKMMIQPTPLVAERKPILNSLAPVPIINRSDVKVNEQDC